MVEEQARPHDTEEATTIDVCNQCKGVWLDGSELERVCRASTGLVAGHEGLTRIGEKGKGIAACPRCAAVPFEVAVKDRVIDVCDTCGGVWLDGAETDAVMRRMKQPLVAGGTPDWLLSIAHVLDRIHDIIEPHAIRGVGADQAD
jgi:Zn-finger nucleic acid-binding protein